MADEEKKENPDFNFQKTPFGENVGVPKLDLAEQPDSGETCDCEHCQIVDACPIKEIMQTLLGKTRTAKLSHVPPKNPKPVKLTVPELDALTITTFGMARTLLDWTQQTAARGLVLSSFQKVGLPFETDEGMFKYYVDLMAKMNDAPVENVIYALSEETKTDKNTALWIVFLKMADEI